MFHNIPPAIKTRMAELEAWDARDRQDGTLHLKRLRQIPPETGRFLALLASSAPPGPLLEAGTSAGYSALWLSLACRQRGDRLITFEVLEDKVRRAQETFQIAEIEEWVELVHGDTRQHLPNYTEIAFLFLDAEKDIYQEIYDLAAPRMAPGGWLVADNVISHQPQLAPFVDHALADVRFDALVVPIGKGLLVCRRTADEP